MSKWNSAKWVNVSIPISTICRIDNWAESRQTGREETANSLLLFALDYLERLARDALTAGPTAEQIAGEDANRERFL